MTGHSLRKEQPPAVLSWHKNAQLEGPGQSSLRPPSDSKARNPTTDSEASSVVNDLGDAKQLAETRRRRSSQNVSTTSTGQLVAQVGANFPETPSRFGNIESDLSQKEVVGGKAKDSAVPLGRKIRAALKTSSWEKERKKFLPLNELENIINVSVIEGELLRHGKDPRLAQDIWGTKGSKSGMTTRRKIFATLVMIDNVPAITDFIKEGIFDSDLPFIYRDATGERVGAYDVYRKCKGREEEKDQEIEIRFFQDWKDNNLESFQRDQWQFLAPYFSLVSKDNKVMHYILDDRSVLPFIEDHKVDEPLAQHGGYADVRHVKIHYYHQNIRLPDNADHPSYAIKRLHSTDDNDFQREVDTLKRFSGNNQHKHLINLLLTYHYRGQYHLLFHWADGNLLQYWNTLYPQPDYPPRDCSFARWVCRQWLGVVEGLQAIHTYAPDPKLPPSRATADPSNPRVHGRHGDLKPENILWFKNPPFAGHDVDDQLGSFVISDFGLAMFHHNKTVNASNLAGTRTYRPPEYDVRKQVSQKCDIWSLGCVMLEFLIWYLRGWKGVVDFQNDRIEEDNCEIPEDVFFNATNKDAADKSVRLKKSVAKIFESLRNEKGTTEFFLDVLELVENKLLRMRPGERAECKEIVERFRDFHNRCQEEWYCTQTICRPQRTPTTLSELMAATPTATSFHETKKRPEISSVMEQESTIQQKVTSTSGRINGHRSPRRVYTAPEPRQSYEYHKEEKRQLAPERGTHFDFGMESMVGKEGVGVSTTPTDMGSPEQSHLDRRNEAIKPRPPIKHGDSGYVSFNGTADSALESTSKKRDGSEMDDTESTAADPRKRLRT